MRLYGRIETNFWQNEKIRCLTEGGRMLYLYLLTCPHGNSAGCFVLHDGYIQADLSWSSERVTKHVTELVRGGFIERDEGTSLTRIIGWWGHNTLENQNVAKGTIKIMRALPRCQVFFNAVNDLKRFDTESVNALVNTFRNEFLNNAQPPEPEPEPEPNPSSEDGAEPFADGSAPAAPAPVLTIPTNRKGEEFPVTQDQIDRYRETYPAVDVLQEITQLRSWSIDNSTRRKTYRGMSGFLNRNLARAQDRGGGARASPPPRTREQHLAEIKADVAMVEAEKAERQGGATRDK